jgi:hypothetical protein
MGATRSELLIKRYFTVAEPDDSETSKSFFGNVFGLLKQTFQEWLQDLSGLAVALCPCAETAHATARH